MWITLTGYNFWYFRSLSQHEITPAVHLPTGGLGAAQGAQETQSLSYLAVTVRSDGRTLLLPSAPTHQGWFAGVRAALYPCVRQESWGHGSCHSISVSRKATPCLATGDREVEVKVWERGAEGS